MKTFGLIFLFLLLASSVAWWITPDVAPAGKTVLTMVSDDCPARRAIIADFNQRNPDLILRLDPDNGGTQKVIVQSLAGVGPDLFDAYSINGLSAYVKAGIAWDITEELEHAGIDIRAETWKCAQPSVIYEGRIYGVPANAGANVLWYNKKIFREHGIPEPKPPWTWEEFIPIAQKLTLRDQNGRFTQYGFAFETWMWKDLFYQFGGTTFSEDGATCTLDSPQVITAVSLMHDLIYKYKVMPSPADEEAMAQEGGWGASTMKLFGAGRLATAIGGRYWLCTLRNYPNLDIGAVELPHGPIRACTGTGRGTLINRHSPHRREALRYLLYMTQPHYNRLLNQEADALAPMTRYCTDEFLFNPKFPNEPFQPVFREVMALGKNTGTGPFANSAVVGRVIDKQIDLIKRNTKTPAEAMKTAADQINEHIQHNLQRYPALRQAYQRLPERNQP